MWASLFSLVMLMILFESRYPRKKTVTLTEALMLEIIHVTAVLDHFLGDTYIFMFIARLILCPVLAFVVDKWVRPIYLEVRNKVKNGWYIFTRCLFFLFSCVCSCRFVWGLI